MRATLFAHPTTPCPFIDTFEVVVQRNDPRGLVIGYVITGDIDKIAIPPKRPSARVDRLWEHTCFEIFLRARDARSYIELNFSPSTEWAAYRFEDHRAGMKELSMPNPPQIFHDEGTAHVMDLEVALELKALRVFADSDIQLGANAVIEDREGRTYYWALRHPPGKPDFHHSDSFALTLPNAGARA